MFNRDSVAVAALSLSGLVFGGCSHEGKAEVRGFPVEVRGTWEAQEVEIGKIGDKKLSLIDKQGTSYLMAAGYNCISVQEFPSAFSLDNPPPCSFTRVSKSGDKEVYSVAIGDSKWVLACAYDGVDLKPVGSNVTGK